MATAWGSTGEAGLVAADRARMVYAICTRGRQGGGHAGAVSGVAARSSFKAGNQWSGEWGMMHHDEGTYSKQLINNHVYAHSPARTSRHVHARMRACEAHAHPDTQLEEGEPTPAQLTDGDMRPGE
jgi:hypothetical protein